MYWTTIKGNSHRITILNFFFTQTQMNVRSVDHVIVSMDIVLTSPENTNVDVTPDTC